MKLACPTCGAEVEFRFDDSFVRVCDSCRSAVARSDRGAETLGTFADLVAIDSPLRLFASGEYAGMSFLLIGMAQLQHASGGVWQEWYAKFGSGTWGWLSEAQGRLYMTFERPGVAVLAANAAPVAGIEDLSPGAQVTIEGSHLAVGERGTATYTSALGEIPYRLAPNTTFRFADLSDGRGAFATLDYGDDASEPAVYAGREVTAAELKISGGEQPVAQTAKTGAALLCPNCGGSLELRAPDQSLRIACPYCADLIDVEHGQLSIIAKQETKPTPEIALGSKATLIEGELTVIGYVGRSAFIDGSWYPFEEYLLHAPNLGFRWLVSSDGHWSYIQPVATGAVTHEATPVYDGVKFAHFQRSVLRVDVVLGELYWRVTAGETVEANDYIAPPAMLSREYSADEQNWSLASYMTPSEVNQAFGNLLTLRRPTGVAPNQPYSRGVGTVIVLCTIALFAVGIVKCKASNPTLQFASQITIPVGTATPPEPPPAEAEPGAEPPGHVVFSDPFPLDHRNIEISTDAELDNNWAYVAIDLVNETTGDVISFDHSLEYYSGYDGESWSEGSRGDSQVLGPVEPGKYMLRVEAQQGSPAPITARISVVQGVFRGHWFWLALGVLAVPFVVVWWHASRFRKKQWENSNVKDHAS